MYYKKYKKRQRLSVTLILIILNIAAFLFAILMISLFGEPFFYKIALQPINILKGKNLWTLITHMFVHVNIGHLFVNLLSLYFLGTFLERLIGKKRFIIIYLISGLVAALFFIFLSPEKQLETAAVGASGAIFGIAGVLTMITPRVPVYLFFIPIPIPLWIAVIFMLSFLWILSILFNFPIGNLAHLGGLIAGVIYGYYLRKKHARKVAILDKIFRGTY